MEGDKIKVGFISGCFDGLHNGHIYILEKIRSDCDIVVIALNDDNYIRNNKNREPMYDEQTRQASLFLSNLVDFVYIFNEQTPIELIKFVEPDILYVGDDYPIESVVGANEVKEWGGEVKIIPRLPGYSSTILYNERTKTDNY